jgi:hypothetical protein
LDLYLHIGTEKTGTTTIQEFLRANRGRLLARGVQYPKLPGPPNQICLTAAALEEVNASVKNMLHLHSANDLEVFRQTLSAALSQAVSGSGCKMAILSNEHCSSRLQQPAEVQTLHDMLRPHFDRIFIVVYLRRQDEFLLSTYSTAVKSGVERELGLPKFSPRHDRRYDYWKLLSRWATVFGRDAMICRRFERSTLKNGDVIDDFLQTVGVENDPAFERPPNQNESLDAASLEFMRLMNAHIGCRGPLRYALWQALEKIGKGPLLTLPAETLAEFMEDLRESNRKVAEEYFGGVREDSGDPLFAPLKFSRPRVERSELALSDAVWIMARVWACANGDEDGSSLAAPEPVGATGTGRERARRATAPPDAIRAARKKERREKRATERARNETPSAP